MAQPNQLDAYGVTADGRMSLPVARKNFYIARQKKTQAAEQVRLVERLLKNAKEVHATETVGMNAAQRDLDSACGIDEGFHASV